MWVRLTMNDFVTETCSTFYFWMFRSLVLVSKTVLILAAGLEWECLDTFLGWWLCPCTSVLLFQIAWANRKLMLYVFCNLDLLSSMLHLPWTLVSLFHNHRTKADICVVQCMDLAWTCRKFINSPVSVIKESCSTMIAPPGFSLISAMALSAVILEALG